MHTLLALAVAAFTACAIAHPGMHVVTDDLTSNILRNGPQTPEPPNRKALRDYLLPRYLMSQYVPEEKRVRIPYPRPPMPASDWLNEEIDRINRMQDPVPQVPYKPELPSWLASEPFKRIIFGPVGAYGTRRHVSSYFDYPLFPSKALMAAAAVPRRHAKVLHQIKKPTNDHEFSEVNPQDKKTFALTPHDPGYFEAIENTTSKLMNNTQEGPHEGGGHEDPEDLGPRRETRQNPISRTKTLVADDLDKLKDGVGSDADELKKKARHFRLLGNDFASGMVYAIGIAAGVGTAIILTILGFVFGWYTRSSHLDVQSCEQPSPVTERCSLSKRAKTAADVDYPAYGVTGPTMDTSGDRKLAHSAQMYHYQHQKQQIIAMERNNEEQRNGSVSDPESEEENEEGDYTVYECPGFATTGDMEVKNPLFHEEPTPATPGKMELVKPQPTE